MPAAFLAPHFGTLKGTGVYEGAGDRKTFHRSYV